MQYTRALSGDPTHVGLLLNRSLTAWKHGQLQLDSPPPDVGILCVPKTSFTLQATLILP